MYKIFIVFINVYLCKIENEININDKYNICNINYICETCIYYKYIDGIGNYIYNNISKYLIKYF